MLAAVVSALLLVPYAPSPVLPSNGGWGRSYGGFEVTDYADDAGRAAFSLEYEIRQADAGYGAASGSAAPYADFAASYPFLPEGSKWCWHARWVNTSMQASPFSTESCFFDDDTSPNSPTKYDGGPAVGSGGVSLNFTPVTDALSGMYGYALVAGPSPTGPFYTYVDPVMGGPPLTGVLGEGNWYLFAAAFDNAFNGSSWDVPARLFPVTVIGDATMKVPPAPQWAGPYNGGYGNELFYDGAWARDAGTTHMIGSFCNVDAGCAWVPGFTLQPTEQNPGLAGAWVQTDDEGYFLARVAGVRNGVVGKWSNPSATVTLIDRTGPLVQKPTVALTSDGGVLISWQPIVDRLSGISSVSLIQVPSDAGTRTYGVTGLLGLQAGTLVPSHYVWHLEAVDNAGNQTVGPDSTGIDILPPPVDAGAVDAGPPDSGTVDAGTVDAGAVDAGAVDAGAVDAGTVDAGSVDAGAVDAGAVDAGPADAGPKDAGPLDAGAPDASQLTLGCGCGAAPPLLPLLGLALLLRRRARRSSRSGAAAVPLRRFCPCLASLCCFAGVRAAADLSDAARLLDREADVVVERRAGATFFTHVAPSSTASPAGSA